MTLFLDFFVQTALFLIVRMCFQKKGLSTTPGGGLIREQKNGKPETSFHNFLKNVFL